MRFCACTYTWPDWHRKIPKLLCTQVFWNTMNANIFYIMVFHKSIMEFHKCLLWLALRLYGAPFVTSILCWQKQILSNKSDFCPIKVTFVWQKLILSDKSNFVYDKITFVWQKQFCLDKNCFCQQNYFCLRQNYFSWDKITLVETKLLLLRQSYFCVTLGETTRQVLHSEFCPSALHRL